MLIKNEYEILQKRFRDQILGKIDFDKINMQGMSMLLILPQIDHYLKHRIETDKVLVGILKDIQGNIASLAETKTQ